MARLQRGENAEIDHINDLVAIAKDDNSSNEDKKDALEELIEIFTPLLLKICSKWSKYFNDEEHLLIPFNDLMADAHEWFIHYTVNKYTIDGVATYNTFIKNHINQRVRFIYETHIKYWSELVLPDPPKNQEFDQGDQLELVIYNYSSEASNVSTIEEDFVDNDLLEHRARLANRINELIETGNYNEREKKIWRRVMVDRITQEAMAKELGISRMRLVQILRKIRKKIKIDMENDAEFWALINKTDIDFDTINW